jgi:monothiol glutaredoxin
MALDPTIKQKIDGLVQQDAVVLFMKGTRSFPQCGFSASVVNILNTLIPKYATVNVLSDPDVRGGMKEYSDWPTFPQLFIKGEFVGGADIVRQMFESGDLEKKLGDLVQAAKAPNLTVTPRAATELKEALKEGSPGDVIHVTITQSWEHQLDIGAKEASHVTVESNGITVQLDRASAARASGVSIDFVEDATGAGFKIENPNRPAVVREI